MTHRDFLVDIRATRLENHFAVPNVSSARPILSLLSSLPLGEARTNYVSNVSLLDVNEILPSSAVSSDFTAHAVRTPPSGSPGIDIYHGLPFDEFAPRVHSDEIVYTRVSGRVLAPVGGAYGTIKIMDRNGYIHKYLHLKLGDKTAFFGLKPGMMVEKGWPIGIEGFTNTIKGHVHLNLSKDGESFDPRKVRYNLVDGSFHSLISESAREWRARLEHYFSEEVREFKRIDFDESKSYKNII